MSRLAPGPTQPPTQCVLRAFSLGIKWLRHEADHLLPSSAKVKNVWCYISTPSYIFMVLCLIKQGITFTLYRSPRLFLYHIQSLFLPLLSCLILITASTETLHLFVELSVTRKIRKTCSSTDYCSQC
jgi:hypothetical protein